MVNTVKYHENVVVWSAFSGNIGRWGLFFLPKNITLAGDNYLEVLKQHMLHIWDIHQFHYSCMMVLLPRKSKLVKRFLKDREIPTWEWPGNSPYLNPIENAWNLMKNNAQEKHPTSITDMNKMLTDLWIHMNP